MTLIHPVLKKSRFRSRHRLIGCLHGGRKILEGVTSFRLVYNVPAEISVRVVPNYRWIQKELKSLKMAGGKKKKKKKFKLGPSAIFTGADNYLSAELWQ